MLPVGRGLGVARLVYAQFLLGEVVVPVLVESPLLRTARALHKVKRG